MQRKRILKYTLDRKRSIHLISINEYLLTQIPSAKEGERHSYFLESVPKQ